MAYDMRKRGMNARRRRRQAIGGGFARDRVARRRRIENMPERIGQTLRVAGGEYRAGRAIRRKIRRAAASV